MVITAQTFLEVNSSIDFGSSGGEALPSNESLQSGDSKTQRNLKLKTKPATKAKPVTKVKPAAKTKSATKASSEACWDRWQDIQARYRQDARNGTFYEAQHY